MTFVEGSIPHHPHYPCLGYESEHKVESRSRDFAAVVVVVKNRASCRVFGNSGRDGAPWKHLLNLIDFQNVT